MSTQDNNEYENGIKMSHIYIYDEIKETTKHE